MSDQIWLNGRCFTLPSVAACQNWSGMHVALRIDIADPDARGIGAAAVPLHQLVDLLGAFGFALAQLEVHVGVVRMVVDRQDFLLQPSLVKRLGTFENDVHGPANLRRRQLVGGVAATRIYEMIKAGALDALGFDEIENVMQIHAIAARERQPQTNFLADRAAVAHPAHCPVERPLLAAENIVGLANAIQRDADVGGAEFLELLRCGFIQ